MDTEQAMKPIRVLVANRPRLMRELMVATISEQPDIEIVGLGSGLPLTVIVPMTLPAVAVMSTFRVMVPPTALMAVEPIW